MIIHRNQMLKIVVKPILLKNTKHLEDQNPLVSPKTQRIVREEDREDQKQKLADEWENKRRIKIRLSRKDCFKRRSIYW